MNIFKRIISNTDIHTIEVIRKSFFSTIVKVSGMVFGLLLSIIIGRTLGPDGLGVINLSNRITTILLIFCSLGIRSVIIKEVAIANSNNDNSHINNVMFTSYIVNGGFSLILSITIIGVIPLISTNIFNEPELIAPLTIFIFSLLPQVLSRLLSSSLIGKKKIWQSNLVDQSLSILVTLIILLILYIFDIYINIINVALCYACGRVVVSIAVWSYWRSVFRYRGSVTLIPRRLYTTAFPLFVSTLSTSLIANFDIIIVGIFVDSVSIGLYTVAMSLALLTSFFLQIVDSVVGPKVAIMFEKGQLDKMEKMLQKVTSILFLFGVLSFLFYLFFGKFILSLWGSGFVNAYWILLILSFGQLVNVGTGAVGQLLIMTGHHRENSLITVIFLIIYLSLNVILLSIFGIIGAAISSTISVVGVNALKVIVAKKKTNISTIKFKW